MRAGAGGCREGSYQRSASSRSRLDVGSDLRKYLLDRSSRSAYDLARNHRPSGVASPPVSNDRETAPCTQASSLMCSPPATRCAT